MSSPRGSRPREPHAPPPRLRRPRPRGEDGSPPQRIGSRHRDDCGPYSGVSAAAGPATPRPGGRHMMDLAFQDQYPEQFSHCFGCGRNNPAGHQIKSYWDGDRTMAVHAGPAIHRRCAGARLPRAGRVADGHPRRRHGFRLRTASSDADEDIRYVTASLTVDFRRPTPIGVELEITGRLKARDGQSHGSTSPSAPTAPSAPRPPCSRSGCAQSTEAPEPQAPGGTTHSKTRGAAVRATAKRLPSRRAKSVSDLATLQQ